LQLRELGRRYPACQVADAEDVSDVEPVAPDPQPLALGQLDDLDGPAIRRAVAVGWTWPGSTGLSRAVNQAPIAARSTRPGSPPSAINDSARGCRSSSSFSALRNATGKIRCHPA